MTDTISYLADALLGHCPKDPRAPHYTEGGFRLKLRAATLREARIPPPTRRNAFDYLMSSEWRGMMRAARLTDRQNEVFGKRLNGWTFEEIGSESGHSRQGAQHIYRQAIKKIGRVLHVYPFRGLSEVYRRESNRGRKHGSKGRMVR